MQQDRDEVDITTAPFGGPFDPNELEDPFADWFRRARQVVTLVVDGLRSAMDPKWANRSLYVTFVPDTAFVAFAKKGGNADHIVISVGLVEIILGTMFGLMSTPSFLPEIGDVSGEEEPEGQLRNGFPRMKLILKNRPNDPIFVYRPSNTARFSFAWQLAEDALQFITLHELGHIVGGHLELCETRGLTPELLEMSPSNTNTIEPELRQVLEHDADMFAAHAQSFVAMHPQSGESLKQTFEWSGVSPKDAGAILYAVTVAVLFRLLEPDGAAPTADPGIEYPHSAVRSNLVLSKGLALAHGSGVISLNLDHLRKLLNESVIPVEEMWARFGLSGRRLGPPSDWADQIPRLSGELIKKHNEYAALLESHARVPRRWHGPWPDLG